jgi:hypothetical protein
MAYVTPSFVSLFALLMLGPTVSLAAEVHFNRDIRPILSDRCFSCHGPDKGNRKANLRLDIEADAKAALKGGRYAIAAGSPEKSEVYKRVTSTNKALRMPPTYMGHDAVPAREVELLRAWIEQGAKYESHWAFIPPQKAALPAVSNPSWTKNSIDSFILSRLDREKLHPAPPADKRTLIRRVTLDLTGLPPTPAEVEAFVNDESPEAYESVVDRLLASPRYAERMAIRWLEAARYSDTNGYQTDGPRTMWPWRDWVIDAFRRDMPYDQFTIEQIAGDLLPNATLSQKVATGFNRNHRTSAEGGIVDEEFRVEYVADRTETTGTVFLGLTVGCARCHDHKFDPITQKDFYSLFAFYNNVPERGFVWNFGNEEPVIKAPSPEQQSRLTALDTQIATYQQQRQQLEPKIRKAQAKWERELAHAKSPVEWSLRHNLQLHLPLDDAEPGKVNTARHFDGKAFLDAGTDGPAFDYRDPFTIAAWIKPESATGAIASRGDDYSEGQQHGLYLMDGKLRLHVTFRWTDLAMRVETVDPVPLGAWSHVAVSYDGGMRAAGVRMYVDGKPQQLKVLFDSLLWPIDTKKHPWRVGAGGGLRFTGSVDDVRVYSRVLTPEETGTLTVLQPIDSLARIDRTKRTPEQSNKLHMAFVDMASPKELREVAANLELAGTERKVFLDSIPSVMVMKEREDRRDTFLLRRGAYDAPGEKVSPGPPAFLNSMKPEWPKNRLGLARWIVDRDNPLTARAAVNRFWAMLFGIGLVKTVEDFGSQGEWPVNQDLLDWLAVEFMDSGWSIKHMLKTMVLSAAYQQSSKVTPDLLQRDPENRSLARGPRFRLSAEMIRDQALAASGLLVDKVGGPPVKPYQPEGLWQELQGGAGYKEDEGEGLYRRSLYTYWRRTVAPPNMVTFDAPTRETCVIRENRTNTPLQALDLMNDVLYVEAARKLAERMIAEAQGDATERIRRGYEIVLGRPAKELEQSALRTALNKFEAFYRAHPKDAETFVSEGKSPRKTTIPPTELAAYTGVASILLNLDEAITKQ